MNASLFPWLLAALRVLPTALLVPVTGVGVWSLPLRAVVALTLAAGTLVAPAPLGDAPWMLACLRELTAGVGLALVLALPFLALEHAAALLSSAGAHAEPLGRLIRWTGAAAFLVARGHHGALHVLAASWVALPPGASPRGDAWVDVCVRATGEAIAGGLVIASAGLVALAAMELSAGLVARVAWPLSREATTPLRALATLGAVTVALRVCVEVAIDLAARSFSLARAMV